MQSTTLLHQLPPRPRRRKARPPQTTPGSSCFGFVSDVGKPVPPISERPAAVHEFAGIADRQDTPVAIPPFSMQRTSRPPIIAFRTAVARSPHLNSPEAPSTSDSAREHLCPPAGCGTNLLVGCRHHRRTRDRHMLGCVRRHRPIR